MTIVNMWAGALTDTGARVTAKLTGVTTARLAVDADPGFTGPTFFPDDPIPPDAEGVVSVTASGLQSGITYFYAVEEDSVINVGTTGMFHTVPDQAGQPVSFTFAASGDAGLTPDTPGVGTVLAANRLSNAPVFDTIRAHEDDPLFFIHLGDMHYYDLGSGSHGIVGGGTAENYRRAIDDVLEQPRQHQLYRDMPLVYVWDDHDYGPNNSDGTLPTKLNAGQVYRERVPSYPLPDTEGAVYHSFQIGRVLFVMWDSRFNRDPAATPNRSMLGVAQRTWFANLLNASDAQLLVIGSPVRWNNGSSDSWPGFDNERAIIADLLESTGWTDRTVMICADVHADAFDSGVNNIRGGFPTYVVGSMDATPFNPGTYDVGVSSARNQYGIFDITDDGETITLSAQAYQGSGALFSHTFVVEPEPVPPEPPSGGDVLPVGTVSPVVAWIGCDLVTGRIIADLPDLEADSISRLLGAYTSSSLSLPIPRSGPGALDDVALQATEPHRTMIVAIVNDLPAWAGIVHDRLGGTAAMLELPCATLESYFVHRYVGDHVFTQIDEAQIAAALAADAGPVLGIGSGIGLEIDAPPTGTLRDREYVDTDNGTVYGRLSELMAVQGGPEWTVELLWGDDAQTFVRKLFRVRKRLGVASPTPQAVFETTAPSVFASRGVSEARYTYAERHAGGLGANVVQAFSSGEGDDQPRSSLAIATDQLAAGFPIYERRFQPSSGITSIATLNDHAGRELELRRNGQRTWEIEARWNVLPRLNIEWRVGDDIAWTLIGHRHPAGVAGQGRCIGWDMDPAAGTVRPILLDPLSNGG